MSATIHTHPRCPSDEIFKIRRAATLAGARYVATPPNFHFATGHADAIPAQHNARRFVVLDDAPFDPNDGGNAA